MWAVWLWAENAFDQTFLLEGMRKEEIFAREPEILRRAKSRMGHIFFDDIDVLVVDRIGKDISGLGMDPNVTGRYCVTYMKPEKRVQHIAVLGFDRRISRKLQRNRDCRCNYNASCQKGQS